jgi:hypothetical protein
MFNTQANVVGAINIFDDTNVPSDGRDSKTSKSDQLYCQFEKGKTV